MIQNKSYSKQYFMPKGKTTMDTQITIDSSHTIYVTQNGVTVTLTENDIRQIESLSNRLYYKQDIISYFNERKLLYNVEELMKNTSLLDNILDKYELERNNADSGDFAASWTACLDNTINQFKHELNAYKLD